MRVAIQKTDSCGFSTRSVVHATCAQYAMVTMSIAGLTAGRRRSHPRSETRRRPVKTCSGYPRRPRARETGNENASSASRARATDGPATRRGPSGVITGSRWNTPRRCRGEGDARGRARILRSEDVFLPGCYILGRFDDFLICARRAFPSRPVTFVVSHTLRTREGRRPLSSPARALSRRHDQAARHPRDTPDSPRFPGSLALDPPRPSPRRSTSETSTTSVCSSRWTAAAASRRTRCSSGAATTSTGTATRSCCFTWCLGRDGDDARARTRSGTNPRR